MSCTSGYRPEQNPENAGRRCLIDAILGRMGIRLVV